VNPSDDLGPGEVEELPPRRRSRFVQAWRVLWGEAVVPDELLTEWASYQLRFERLLRQFSAQLARDSRAAKRTENQEPQHREVSPSLSRKQHIRRQIAEAKGLGSHRLSLRPSSNAVPISEPEEAP